jgi:hypothetical protein
VAVVAKERMKKTGQDLSREAKDVWKPPTIKLGDIEGHHRNETLMR